MSWKCRSAPPLQPGSNGAKHSRVGILFASQPDGSLVTSPAQCLPFTCAPWNNARRYLRETRLANNLRNSTISHQSRRWERPSLRVEQPVPASLDSKSLIINAIILNIWSRRHFCEFNTTRMAPSLAIPSSAVFYLNLSAKSELTTGRVLFSTGQRGHWALGTSSPGSPCPEG